MLRVWRSPEFRPTMDIDVLGTTSNEPASVVVQIRDVLSVEVEPDGMVFDATTIQSERIAENADYEGIRIRFRGVLDSAKIRMRMDVGFGDIVFPGPKESDLPTVLDFPRPRLLCCSRESTIAEKFEAILKPRELNSRMKDFYDIWLLSRWFDFEGGQLVEAIRRTLERRGTQLSDDVVAFSDRFVSAKQMQWTAFRRRLKDGHVPVEFAEVMSAVRDFLSPIVNALISGTSAPIRWTAPGPWTRQSSSGESLAVPLRVSGSDSPANG